MSDSIVQLGVFAGAAAVSLIAGPLMIPWLRRLKIGQSIREEGPQSHLVKSGTPTMGGFIILLGLVTALPFIGVPQREALIVLAGTLGFGAIGFYDDYIKVVKKRNLGLRAWQKIVGQIVAAALVTALAWVGGTDVLVPGALVYWETGLLFIPLMVLGQIFFTNSVNLTDGLDGLAGGITFVVLLFFAAAAGKYGTPQTGLLALGLAGGCLGFLRVNRHPARVFMGDTGSLALGGALAGLAVAMKLPLILPVVGLIYILEALSVVLQVGSFKLTGKRVFKMAPLHHHFELSGWKETKVVRVFWAVTLVMALAAWLMIG